MLFPFINLLLSIFLWCLPLKAWSACHVITSSSELAKRQSDELSQLLFSNEICPKDVFEFRRLLKNAGLKLNTTMVANKGFHNPSEGSFSLFEMVVGQSKLSGETLKPGDFFFGHFTAISPDGYLVADQAPTFKALMIEAFAWDAKKEVFNFYELRGDGKQGQWFYRGDSADILADNQYLHRQPDEMHPRFGNRLRCSACHDNGGPIMKELSAPYNDWWEPKRKLDLGGRKPDVMLSEILQTLVPADRLSQSIHLGIKKLENSNRFAQQKATLALQEQLRPLFCPQEVNFLSDLYPNEERRVEIIIPNEFFIDSRLLPMDGKPIILSREAYEKTLDEVGSRFAETDLKDADHAWLAPVKASSDKAIIGTLVKKGMIDKKFVADVLSIDMTNPVFSPKRCELLQFVPNKITPDWQKIFIQNLIHSQQPAAQELAMNLKNSARTPHFHQKRAAVFLNKCRMKLRESKNVGKLYQLLMQRRAEIAASQISANPLGQILEPGFRVIFPHASLSSVAGKLKLTSDCDVIENE